VLNLDLISLHVRAVVHGSEKGHDMSCIYVESGKLGIPTGRGSCWQASLRQRFSPEKCTHIYFQRKACKQFKDRKKDSTKEKFLDEDC